MKIKKETPWVEKYRPNYFAEIFGQDLAKSKVKNFIENFVFKKESLGMQHLTKSTKPKRSLILYGPPGTGKTTLALVAAKEANAEVFELNASDLRNRNNLKEVLKPAMEQRSLIKENKIILVDEVDGISKVDWGGLAELLILIETSTFPVIITANDIWNKKFNTLRTKSEMVQVKEINSKIIKDVLINILKKENIFVPIDVINQISTKSKGDLRAAINDLQTISKLDDLKDLNLDDRNKEVDIFNALRTIFKKNPDENTSKIFDSVNMQIDEIILWVEENLPSEYSGEELARAIDILSKVDIFKGRIYKQQYWRFLVYEYFLLSYGISSAKAKEKSGFTSYKKPSRILKIWLNNQKNAKKKSIAQKYATYVHVGIKRAMNEFPMIKPILQNSQVQKELKLTNEEIEYILR